ncbi:hypothetical protein TMatcc_000509, partial [Talaromyces marneffei ATCC 18224]
TTPHGDGCRAHASLKELKGDQHVQVGAYSTRDTENDEENSSCVVENQSPIDTDMEANTVFVVGNSVKISGIAEESMAGLMGVIKVMTATITRIPIFLRSGHWRGSSSP